MSYSCLICRQETKTIRIDEMKTISSEPKSTEFAIKMDVSRPIVDFHQRVPDMAYKVRAVAATVSPNILYSLSCLFLLLLRTYHWYLSVAV